ncbi:hypothetical protein ACC717_38260, partial [Rhizobium ruizarguesonis]
LAGAVGDRCRLTVHHHRAAGQALVAVNTSERKAKPSGRLAIVDVATKKIEKSCDLGGQPDSIALNKDKTLGAIAIAN